MIPEIDSTWFRVSRGTLTVLDGYRIRLPRGFSGIQAVEGSPGEFAGYLNDHYVSLRIVPESSACNVGPFSVRVEADHATCEESPATLIVYAFELADGPSPAETRIRRFLSAVTA